MLISTREIISALSQKHTDLQSHQVVFCCLSLVLVGQSLVFNGLVKGGTGLSMSSTGDRMDWLSCRSALEGDGLGYRASGRRRFQVQSLGKETVSGTEPREGEGLGFRASGRRRSRAQSLGKETVSGTEPREGAYRSGTVSLLAGTAAAGPSPQPSCVLGCHCGT